MTHKSVHTTTGKQGFIQDGLELILHHPPVYTIRNTMPKQSIRYMANKTPPPLKFPRAKTRQKPINQLNWVNQ